MSYRPNRFDQPHSPERVNAQICGNEVVIIRSRWDRRIYRSRVRRCCGLSSGRATRESCRCCGRTSDICDRGRCIVREWWNIAGGSDDSGGVCNNRHFGMSTTSESFVEDTTRLLYDVYSRSRSLFVIHLFGHAVDLRPLGDANLW